MKKIIFSAAMLTAALATAQNTGIGTTAPKAKLDVIGGIRVLKGLPTTTADGSNIGYAFDQDGDTGIFADGANSVSSSNILIYSDNQPRLFIGGNLKNGIGIGTVNPAASLDVVGNFKLTDGTQGVGKVLTSDANGLAKWLTPTAPPVYTGSTSVPLNGTTFERAALTGDVTAAQNSNDTTIAPNAVTSAKIADGTITAADLSPMGATSAGQNLTWNGTAWVPTTPASVPTEPWNIVGSTNPATNNNQNIYQTGSISAGIGNDSWGGAVNAAGIRSSKGAPGNDDSKTGYSFSVDGDTGMFAIGGQPGVGSDISFYIDNQKNLTIKSGGNIGVGNDSPTEKLDVTGNIKSTNLAGSGDRVVVADEKGVLKIGSVADTPNIYTSDGALQGPRNINLNSNNLNFSGQGNLAIGNAAPQAKLDIQGNIRIADGTQGSGKFLMSDNNGVAQWAVPATTYQNYVGVFPNNKLIYPSSTISTADNFYSKTSFSITLAPGQYQVFVNGAASMFPERGNPITGYSVPYTEDNKLNSIDEGIRFRAVFSTLSTDTIGLNNVGGAVQEDSSAGTTNISYPFDQNQISFSTVIVNSTTGNVTYNLYVKAYKRGTNDKYIYDAFNGRWAEDKISAIRIGN